jgi:DNA-binding MarR family transcriptional regulator
MGRSGVVRRPTKSGEKPCGALADTRNPVRRKAAAPSPTAMIEAELSPSGEPVLGLYLHVAYMAVIASFAGQVGQGDITPNLIGVLALIARAPGTNQAELARLVGLEPATVGQQVSRAVERGLVRRDHSAVDKRSYTLRLTPRGEAMLKTLRERIPPHEKMIGSKLSPSERKQLRGLLDKLVYG